MNFSIPCATFPIRRAERWDVVNTARFFLSRLESLFAAQKVFQIFRGRAELVRFAFQRRDCVIYSVPLSLLSINPTDSPDSRISVWALVVLSVGLCQSRKDRYLPLETQCVRLLPHPTGLPPMAFAVSFHIRFADAKTAVKHHRSKRADGRFCVGDNLTVVPRPKNVTLGMYAMCSIFRLSPPDVLPVLKNLVTC